MKFQITKLEIHRDPARTLTRDCGGPVTRGPDARRLGRRTNSVTQFGQTVFMPSAQVAQNVHSEAQIYASASV